MILDTLIDLKNIKYKNVIKNYDKIEIRAVFYPINELEIKTVSIEDINILFLQFKDSIFIYGFSDFKSFIQNSTKIIQEMDKETFEFKEVRRETIPKSLTIDTEKKGYCFEIINDNYKKELLKINFITTNAEVGCSKQNGDCKSLNYLFNIIFNFLDMINYDQPLLLQDDSQIDNSSLLLFNLLKDKESIYCKYGFQLTKEGWYRLNKHKDYLLNLRLFLQSNYPDFKLDDKYRSLLNFYFDKKGKINIQAIDMINYDYIKNYEFNCKFTRRCYNKFDFNCFISQKEYNLFSSSKYKKYLLLLINKSLKSFGLILKLNPKKLDLIKVEKNKNYYYTFCNLIKLLDVLSYQDIINFIYNQVEKLYIDKLLDRKIYEIIFYKKC